MGESLSGSLSALTRSARVHVLSSAFEPQGFASRRRKPFFIKGRLRGSGSESSPIARSHADVGFPPKSDRA